MYVNFTGWAQLSETTKMVYSGLDGNLPPTITVKKWAELDPELQQCYSIKNAHDAIRDAEHIVYNEVSEVYQ